MTKHLPADGDDRERSIIVTTVTYEGSFQQENLARLKFEAFSAWPTPMPKLTLSDL